MTHPQSQTPAKRPSWWERVSERCYRASTPALARGMQNESPGAFHEVVNDITLPLDATFEQEVAKQLAQGTYVGFRPAQSLMPVMVQRFGLVLENLGEKQASLETTCNACPVVGHCWKSLRHTTDVETFRDFCPNADSFDRMGAHVEE
ncbi:hypothetical protein GPM19_07005 [Halomonas sp. ZH2S]|uniref:Uncharacterized protein n=1 Tax=Vreelandella zhuhanensis TaxID=2684210 RepID=A0A7X3GZX3_9GAMM|nr:hypothetical protein [Halomonas zhuhanensis]MWJ27956.1 hypothetical protein [Halomonas zhuhanensis]